MSPVTAPITHVFFDIGGVLGTNGWDREQRAAAAARFGLDADFEHRHHEVVGDWEVGAMAWDEYLDVTVFHEPRAFTREEFRAFVLDASQPFADSIALARAVARTGRVRLYTLNNEPEELNVHRVQHFGLRDVFSTFFSSCWLGMRKPSHLIFRRAMALAQATPETSLFIDDREQNVAPAQRLGMRTALYRDAGELEGVLREMRLL